MFEIESRSLWRSVKISRLFTHRYVGRIRNLTNDLNTHVRILHQTVLKDVRRQSDASAVGGLQRVVANKFADNTNNHAIVLLGLNHGAVDAWIASVLLFRHRSMNGMGIGVDKI